jgi:hypothetical protein
MIYLRDVLMTIPQSEETWRKKWAVVFAQTQIRLRELWHLYHTYQNINYAALVSGNTYHLVIIQHVLSAVQAPIMFVQ